MSIIKYSVVKFEPLDQVELEEEEKEDAESAEIEDNTDTEE